MLPSPALSKMLGENHASTAQEAYFRVALWLAALKDRPTPERIANHFGVSRATSYRWLSAWIAARGEA